MTDLAAEAAAYWQELREARAERRAARGAATRRIVTRNGKFGCSDCAFTTALPKVGLYGHRTGKARVASMRGTFANHVCAQHPV